ncbi:ankyrin repeat-containing domain protein [Lentinula aciculospora]|uniref:Ankyrin repeat-containing domain protein n=1 Tax=Lentinula aciculospora TaxID=153920 RepID=A0A9W9DQ26_9AGAR|nr:ankyrin repeat-containing domain protein [Lentinula aciculospora]
MSTLSIHSAAQTHQIGLLRTLVSQDPSLLNAVDADERTPLHWAASSGDLDIVRYLIDQKAEVDKVDGSSWSALHIAEQQRDHTPTLCSLKVAYQHRKDFDIKRRRHKRKRQSKSNSFTSRSHHRTRLNTQDRMVHLGNTPLHLAMDSAHAQAAVVLIEAGADRSRLNQDGEAPEDMDGVGGVEQRRAKQHVEDSYGKP